MKTLREVSEEAWAEGRRIDLTGVCFGPHFGTGLPITRTSNEYFFLAGLVRTQRLKYILEVGTYCGGSIMAMSRGLHEGDRGESRLVTIDVIYENEKGFRDYPRIKRIHGDSLADDVVKKAADLFGTPIDLLYIDSIHGYEPTKKNLEIYGSRLDPRFVVFDDICLNAAMDDLWTELEERYGEDAYDITDLINRGFPGHGIVRYRKDEPQSL